MKLCSALPALFVAVTVTVAVPAATAVTVTVAPPVETTATPSADDIAEKFSAVPEKAGATSTATGSSPVLTVRSGSVPTAMGNWSLTVTVNMCSAVPSLFDADRITVAVPAATAVTVAM